jgi:3',5'-cyclic AMP phosphodiesterase CpdA
MPAEATAMPRPTLRALVPIFLLAVSTCAAPPEQAFRQEVDSAAKPWTHESFDNDDDRFTFAIFSDLYGGERERVFGVAMAQLQLLRPELILNVGDLIDGGTTDLERLDREWDEFDAKLDGLKAPVFYIGGNHDLTNPVMRQFWEERYGQRYYHFVYKDVLFLMLDSEDFEEQRMNAIYEARAYALRVDAGEEPGVYEETEYYNMPERLTGAIRAEQASYFRQAIAENPSVRWTFLLMHKPVWRDETATEFQSIEASLGDRPYTVINGHFHSYSLTERNGRDYIHLSTTSGAQNPNDDMAFDHVTLVSMTDDGPSIANLRLDGILDKTGHVPLNGDDLCFQASACVDPDQE